MTYAQSEKIKAGLIWSTQAVETCVGLPEAQRPAAVRIVAILVNLVGQDIALIRRLSGESTWLDIEKRVERALVMINSGVPHEASYHLTRALTRVTTIGQRTMSVLQAAGLL
jgi:hypothetical protein